MNTKAKGRRAELEFAHVLKTQDYIVEIVKKSSKFHTLDLFGIADIVALNQDGIHLIQVKSNRAAGAVKKINDWLTSNQGKLPKNLQVLLAIRHDGKNNKKPSWTIRKFSIDN